MSTFIIIACCILAVVLAAEIYAAVRIVRKEKSMQLKCQELTTREKNLQKRQNDLDNWEHQIKGDVKSMKSYEHFEKVTIAADNNPSKKKARKLLASKFGYDVIDLIKIHETKHEDGSATYAAVFSFNYKEGAR